MNTRDRRLLRADTKELLGRCVDALPSRHAPLAERLESEILARLPHYTRIADFTKPARLVEITISEAAAHLSTEERFLLKRALIARVAGRLTAIVDGLNLPDSILSVYPDACARLASYLTTLRASEEYEAKGEYFPKDLRFVLGLTVPCGARDIDLTSQVAPQTVVLSILRSRDMSVLFRYLRAGGTGRWFRHHVDSRYVSEFTEAGLDRCYLRVADLLERRESIRGIVGTSWYYDPQVAKINPRLAYLQRLRERGAFFLRHGTSASAVRNATKTSETRRRLHQEGKYIPLAYSMLWPRTALLSWAQQWRAQCPPLVYCGEGARPQEGPS